MSSIFLYPLMVLYGVGAVYNIIVFVPAFRPQGRIDSMLTDLLQIISILVISLLWPVQVTLLILQNIYEAITHGKTTIF